MPKWTDEQQLAIDKDGTNIIVSASAGSGKTAVLTERVIQKLKHGTSIDHLLILTFTKAAAKEMKERIKDGILKDESLHKELAHLDKAYITTFDSFSLSILKKYHYILNISNNITPEEGGILKIEEKKQLDKIMDENYLEKNPKFLQFIFDFCLKDDSEIKKNILSLNAKLDLKVDKEEYLLNYIKNYYSEESIDERLDKYLITLKEKIKDIATYLELLSSYVEGDYLEKVDNVLKPLINSDTYEEIKEHVFITLPNLPKNVEPGAKDIKDNINKIITELKEMCDYKDTDEIKNLILKTKDNVEVIVGIILELTKRMNDFKEKNELYSFNDIAIKAINILKNNQEILEELKSSFDEIMVDEYQDTSDIQETFINLISNHNVYMVGDIKQSIYRFRNANPYIFKNKYDNYKNNIDGYKIDLSKNFRSRREVLDDINRVFDHIMDDFIGGAKYKEEHQMVFGNNDYEEKCMKDNNHFEVYNYNSKESNYTNEEIECFFIANDIKNKIQNKYQVMDKKTSKLRDITYNDFVILMDKSKNFALYKKIFEYLNIPLTIKRDESMMKNININIIKNLINLVIHHNNKNYDKDFLFSFMSIGRSYLFEYSDDFLFKCVLNKDYSSTLFDKIDKMKKYLDSSISEFLNALISEFDIYSKLIKIGNIDEHFLVLDYLENTSKNLENLGYNVDDFYLYLNDLIKENLDIKYSIADEFDDSVKIMTIHGSKGLEFPICYYSGLYSKFNIRELNEKILFDDKIIIPALDNGFRKTIDYYLLKNNYLKEEISEEIRLFYVALTRAREKMIIINQMDDKESLIMDNIVIGREKYRSFKDILNSITSYLVDFTFNIDVNSLNLTKNYNFVKKIDIKTSSKEKLEVKEINIENEDIENKRFSKNNIHYLTKEEKEKFEFGEKIHYALEMLDFKNPNFDELDIPIYYKEKIKKFLNSELVRDGINFYKEYEFIEKDNDIKHGIIDLIIETEDTLKIIDYKLKNIDDNAYIEQLLGYENYLKKISNKKIEKYLYSIVDETIKRVN